MICFESLGPKLQIACFQLSPTAEYSSTSKYLGIDLLLFAIEEEKYCRGQGWVWFKEQYVKLLMEKKKKEELNYCCFCASDLFLKSALSQSDPVSLVPEIILYESLLF